MVNDFFLLALPDVLAKKTRECIPPKCREYLLYLHKRSAEADWLGTLSTQSANSESGEIY